MSAPPPAEQPILTASPYAPQRAAKPPRERKWWDVLLTIVLLVVTLSSLLLAGLVQLFAVAFIDDCPPATCDGTAGVASQFVFAGAMALVYLIGAVVAIALLVARRRAWWVVVVVMILEIVLWVGAQVALQAFTGYGWLAS